MTSIDEKKNYVFKHLTSFHKTHSIALHYPGTEDLSLDHFKLPNDFMTPALERKLKELKYAMRKLNRLLVHQFTFEKTIATLKDLNKLLPSEASRSAKDIYISDVHALLGSSMGLDGAWHFPITEQRDICLTLNQELYYGFDDLPQTGEQLHCIAFIINEINTYSLNNCLDEYSMIGITPSSPLQYADLNSHWSGAHDELY